MTPSGKSYTHEELRTVAFMAAGLGAAAVMRKAPHVVMPTEDIEFGVEEILSEARDGLLPLDKSNNEEER